MDLINGYYNLSNTSVAIKKNNEQKIDGISNKNDFKKILEKIILFLENTNIIFDNQLKDMNYINRGHMRINFKISIVTFDYGGDYIFIKKDNSYNILKILHQNKTLEYKNIENNEINTFKDFLTNAINNLEENFKNIKKELIDNEIKSIDVLYKSLNDYIINKKKDISNSLSSFSSFSSLKNNENQKLNTQLNKESIKTVEDINKDIENAITEINKIKMNEESKILKITDKVNTELGL